MKIRHKLMLLAGLQLLVVLLHQTYILNNVRKLHSSLKFTEVALKDLTSGLDFRFSILRFIDLKYDRLFLIESNSREMAQVAADLENQLQNLSSLNESSYLDAFDGPRAVAVRNQYRELIRLFALSESIQEDGKRHEQALQAFIFFQKTFLRSLDFEIKSESESLSKIYQEMSSSSGGIPLLKSDLYHLLSFIKDDLLFLMNLTNSLQLFIRSGKNAIIDRDNESWETYLYFEKSIEQIMADRKSPEQWHGSPSAGGSVNLVGIDRFFQFMPGTIRAGMSNSYGTRTQRMEYIRERVNPRVENEFYPLVRNESKRGIGLAQQKESMLRMDLTTRLENSALIVITLFLLLSFLAFLTLKGMIRSLETLKTAAQRFSEGDLAYRTIPQSKDELSELGACFNIMAEKIQQQQAELIKSERVSSLVEISAGIAHEINNPLSIIQGRARQLMILNKRNNLQSSLIIDIAENIDATCNRIAHIIRNLKIFAQVGNDEPFKQEPAFPIIRSALDLVQTRPEASNVRWIFQGSSGDIQMECRSQQVVQALLQLLHNALDMALISPDPWVAVDLSDDANRVRITVKDSGAGVPEGIRDKIVEPFFTTKDIGKGVGLGLSIAYGIVHSHGGQLAIDPNSKATSFVLTFPKHQSHS